jgi:hypothetical protein
MMVRNRYDDPTMKVAIWQKDMQVIGAFAAALRCPTPLFTATQPIYDAALAGGHAQDDTASVCAVLEAKAGVRRPQTAKAATKRTVRSVEGTPRRPGISRRETSRLRNE